MNGRTVVLFVLVLLLSGTAFSQMTSGIITGLITDQSAAIVPQAKVTLLDEASQDARQATASETGEFVFAALRPGTYTLTVEKPGFQTFKRTGIVLALSERLALGDIRLTVGQATEA